MSNQPEALRLADELVVLHGYPLSIRAAAELRRLHALNQELVEALKEIAKNAVSEYEDAWCGDIARAVLAKVKEQT
jgi:hypothetical protein